jgi:hypothetical protein
MADHELNTENAFPGWAVCAFPAAMFGIGLFTADKAWQATNFGKLTQTIKTTEAIKAGETTNTIEESLFLLTPARFGIAILFLAGWSLICVGVGLAMADAVRVKVVVRAEVQAGFSSTGVPAALTAIANAVAAVASALKDLRASVACLTLGAVLFAFGGVVAWQTIPGAEKTSSLSTISGTSSTATTGVIVTSTTPSSIPLTVTTAAEVK